MIRLLAKLPTGRRSKFAVLLVAVLAAGALGSQSGRLTEVSTSDPAASLPEGAESLQVARAEQRFGDDTVPAIVVARRAAGLGQEDRERLEALAESLRADPVPLQVDVAHPQPSEDETTIALPVTLRAGDSDETVEAVQALRERARTGAGGDLRVAVTGGAAFSADISSVFDDLDVTLVLIAGGLVLVLLVLIYRSPVFWIVPFGVVVAIEAAARGAGALLADLGLTVTGQSGGILIVLVFGAATDYALLLVARYREALRSREDPHDAMRFALERTAPAILASAATVVAGLLTLLLARVGSTQAIGPLGAAGIALALVFSLTALPAALVLAGRRAFWPFIPRVGSETETGSGLWARVAATIPRRPRATWLAAAALLVVLSVGLVRIDTNLTQRDWFTAEVEAVEGQELLAAGFPGGVSAPTTVLVDDPARAADVRDALGESELVAAVGEPEEGPPGARLEVILRGDPYAPETVVRVPELREAARRGSEGALVGGPTAEERDLREAALRDTLVVPPVALAVVLIILVALLRAAVAPVLLLVTVVASNAAAVGLGVLVSDLVFGFPAMDPTVPLLAFVFLVALGIDYNIFLTTRAREEAEREGARAGILSALAVTGGVITAAGIVLAGTFTTLAVLPLVILTQIGVIVALGVLIDALLVRSLLVPALAHDLGRRFWWPARVRD